MKFIVTTPDESLRAEIAKWDTSAADAEDSLKKLSPREISEITRDQAGLRNLLASLRAIQELPAKEYVALTDDGALIGYIRVSGYGSHHPDLEIQITPGFRRQGYGREFLRRVMQEVFCTTGAERIVYRVRPDNIASIRLIGSLGGILREPDSVAEKLLMRQYWVTRDQFLDPFRQEST